MMSIVTQTLPAQSIYPYEADKEQQEETHEAALSYLTARDESSMMLQDATTTTPAFRLGVKV